MEITSKCTRCKKYDVHIILYEDELCSLNKILGDSVEALFNQDCNSYGTLDGIDQLTTLVNTLDHSLHKEEKNCL